MTRKISNKLSTRSLTARVKTAKRRKLSSTRWLQRQLNDPFVIEAKRLGYRSRAAFKLMAIDDQFKFLKPGKHVIDLGAAPGGWTQVAVDRVNSLGTLKGLSGKVIGIDLKDIDNIPGATLITEDFVNFSSSKLIESILLNPVDIILSDMATPSTGHATTDHIRIMSLLENAIEFSINNLSPGGVFLGKVLQGGTEKNLLKNMKCHFKTIKHVKPPASRSNSRENYVIAEGFRLEK